MAGSITDNIALYNKKIMIIDNNDKKYK